MTQLTVPNNYFSNNSQQNEKNEVKPNQAVSTNSEASEFEIPAILKNSFKEIYHGPSLFRFPTGFDPVKAGMKMGE